MILPQTPGHRKPTLGVQQDSLQADFPSEAKGISVLAVMATAFKISGNMTPLLILGHKKQTSVVAFVAPLSALPLATRGMLERDRLRLILMRRTCGNMILRQLPGLRKLI